jgi:L-serine deaminase
MSLDLYPEFYNDVFGPVMQPGSCSHTTGPCRLGYLAGGTPEQVENAASLSLQAATGIPSDPLPGGFGQPCRSRILTAICMEACLPTWR